MKKNPVVSVRKSARTYPTKRVLDKKNDKIRSVGDEQVIYECLEEAFNVCERPPIFSTR